MTGIGHSPAPALTTPNNDPGATRSIFFSSRRSCLGCMPVHRVRPGATRPYLPRTRATGSGSTCRGASHLNHQALIIRLTHCVVVQRTDGRTDGARSRITRFQDSRIPFPGSNPCCSLYATYSILFYFPSYAFVHDQPGSQSPPPSPPSHSHCRRRRTSPAARHDFAIVIKGSAANRLAFPRECATARLS